LSAYERLLADLAAGKVAPVYLFYGREDYLRDRALALLQKKLFGPAVDSFNLDLLDGEQAGVAEILGCARTPPVGAPRRLVVVRDAPFFREGDKGGDTDSLAAYIKKPVPGTCLVFLAGETVDRRRVLFKACQGAGVVLEFAPLDAREVGRWIGDRVRREGFRITPGAVDLLAGRYGRNLWMLEQELKKALLYAWDEKRIDEQAVEAVGSRWVEESIFAVVDAIGEKKWSRAMAGIDDLLAQKEPPQFILTMVARQLRLILQALWWRRAGGPSGEFGSQNRLPPFVVRKLWDQTANFTPAQVENALVRLAELDAGIKTGRQEFYGGFFDFLLSMAVEQDRPAGGPGER